MNIIHNKYLSSVAYLALYLISSLSFAGSTWTNLPVQGGSGAAAWGSITGTLSNQTDLQNALNAKQNTLAIPLPIASGGTNATSVPTSASASNFAAWDSNSNLFANNVVPGMQIIGATGGTTTLTAFSPQANYVTGSNSQTIKLPVVSTLKLNTPYYVFNNTNSGTVFLVSSGGNALTSMGILGWSTCRNILQTGTSAASWACESLFALPLGGDLTGYLPNPGVATVGGASASAIGNWINNGHLSVNTASISMNTSNAMVLQAPNGSGAFQALDGVGSSFLANADASIGMFSSTGLSAQLNPAGVWAVLAATIAEGDLSGTSITTDGGGNYAVTTSLGSTLSVGAQFSISDSTTSSIASDVSGNINITPSSGITNISGLIGITVQAPGTTPTCGAAGQTTYTSAFVLCVCNGSGWVHASTGLVACSF